jgi:hypothetical protein
MRRVDLYRSKSSSPSTRCCPRASRNSQSAPRPCSLMVAALRHRGAFVRGLVGPISAFDQGSQQGPHGACLRCILSSGCFLGTNCCRNQAPQAAMGPNSRTDLYQTLDFWAEHLDPVCRPIWLTRPPCVAADKNLSHWPFLVPSV